MPKIKLTYFNGIYTNKDENDPIDMYERIDPQGPPFDVLKDSVNFRHDWGFLTFEPRNLTQYTLPDVDTYTGDVAGTWKWENGIYVILTNDELAQTPVPAQYRTLVLIAKRLRGTTWDRLVWMQWLDDPTLTWYEMSKNGNYSGLNIINGVAGTPMDFTQSLLSTDKDGIVKFALDKGALKIYMPHDCFWLGRLERTLYVSFMETTTFDQFYFDRLVEPFNVSNLYTAYNPMVVFGITLPNPAEPICSTGRRMGLSLTPTILDTQTTVVDEVAMDMSYQGNATIGWILGLSKPNTFIYEFTNHDTGQIIAAPTDPFINYPTTDSAHMYAYFAETSSTGTMLIPAYQYNGLGGGFTEFMKFQDGTSLDAKYGPVVNGVTLQDGTTTSRTGGYYQVSKATFDSDVSTLKLNYTGSQAVSSIGFANTVKRVDLVVTEVLDEQEEVIMYTWGQDLNVANAKFVLEIDSAYPARDGNFRGTRLRYYLKKTGDADYNLVKEVNYLDPNQKDSRTFYISDSGLTSATGTTLSQNIGFLFDPKSPAKYKIITAIKDIATVDGVSLCVTSDDYINVYYSVVGGGVLQSNLFYTANILQLTGLSVVTAVAPLTTDFAVTTLNNLYVVKAANEAGVLAFIVKDSLEYGVKNKDDMAFRKDGTVILNTKNGIFATDGHSELWESKPINDICENSFSTSRISYNIIKHEIYFIPGGNIQGYYRYRMNRAIVLMYGRRIAVWEKIDPTTTVVGDSTFIFDMSAVSYILTDLDGNQAFLMERGLYIAGTEPSNHITAQLSTNRSDLGEASLDKLMDYYDIDHVGTGTISITSDAGTLLETTIPSSTTRYVHRIYHPLDKRIPCQKIGVNITTTDPTFIMYGVEVNFGTVKRRVLYG